MSQTIGYEELVRAARVYAAECVGWIAPALYSARGVLRRVGRWRDWDMTATVSSASMGFVSEGGTS